MKKYKCVACGEAHDALYKTYGPSVVKLTKCQACNRIVDRYIEYDPVIVMIDLVLVSKEAQRHVIYNTEFKSYWKLFIILVLLETYGVWRNDSILNIAINSLCDIQTNTTINSTYLDLPYNISMPEAWKPVCQGWQPEQRVDDSDLFIWEKDFYVQFLSTFAGIAAFIMTVHGMMKLLASETSNKASFVQLLKAFSLADVSVLLTLPTLVWSTTHTAPETRALHYTLVVAYTQAMFFCVFSVLYESHWTTTFLVLVFSSCAKYLTSFHVTPFLRAFVT